MTACEQEKVRRTENIVLAHAEVQGKLVLLMMGVAGGYDGLDGTAALGRLVDDAQDVVEAATLLRDVIATGGDMGPEL